MSRPVDLHRLTWGEKGPLVVLVHGLTGRASLWGDVARRLAAAGYRVVAPDLRGHGASPRAASYTLAEHTADLIALLEATGPAHLVGHSLGAALAWRVAAGRPDLVQRLVLEDQHPNAAPSGWQGWRDWAAAWPDAFASEEEGLEFLRHSGRTADWWRPSLQALPDGTWGWAMDKTAVVETARSLCETEGWADLSRLRCPTLIIRGADSPHLKAEVAERMAATIPGARLVTVPGRDHWVHREAGPYTALLTEFFGA